MSENIKIIGFPRTGNQWFLLELCYLTLDPVTDDFFDWSRIIFSHDHQLNLEINHPIVYLCRNPLETVYSRMVADRNWHQQNGKFHLMKDRKFRMQEYRNHLEKFYNSNNLIITYKQQKLLHRETLEQAIDFLNLRESYEMKGGFSHYVQTPRIDKEKVIEFIKPQNSEYYNYYLLREYYAKNRQKFIEKHRDEFLEYFKDYPELFE